MADDAKTAEDAPPADDAPAPADDAPATAATSPQEDKPSAGDDATPPNAKSSDEVSPPLISKETDADKSNAKEKRGQKGGNKYQNKKTVVLTGDSLKEMQKQQKANKEERRSQLDLRYKYIFTAIADIIQVDYNSVEDMILGDDKFDLIDPFFATRGTRKILFYYQEPVVDYSQNRNDGGSTAPAPPTNLPKKLFVTNGLCEPLIGVCIYFLRIATDKAITVANIAGEVFVGQLSSVASCGRILQGVEQTLSKVLVPLLSGQDSWGHQLDQNKEKITSFIEELNNFVESLENARTNMSGHVTLAESEHESLWQGLRTQADYTSVANNCDVIEKLEEILLMWQKQIEQVLTEAEQIRREADNIGPTAELTYWKGRMAKFNTLLEQIKGTRCKTVVGILNTAKSKAIINWRHLDSRITDAANQAKDNVKYLCTLDKFFGPLIKHHPGIMVENIPSLMNAIRMIYSISSYYNTSERMTSLFVKITNQMITTCKTYIHMGVSKIWDHPRKELQHRIMQCQKLNAEYQRQFQKTRQILKESDHGRQFEFSENYIFGKFDTFCRRLERISYQLNTIQEYSGLADIRIEGIDGIIVKYKTIVDSIKKKNYDILDHRKVEFDIDYDEFKSQFDALQMQIQNFVEMWFEKPLNTKQAIDLLIKVEQIKGPNLDLKDKYMKVIAKYSRDLEEIRKLYQKQKHDPSGMRNLPPIAARISWSRQLYRKIEMPMKHFKRKPEILRTDEGKKIIKNYNKMASILMEYELLYHREWFRAVEKTKDGLNSSLLVMHPKTEELFVNFDMQILELLAETRYMKRMNLDIPPTAMVLDDKMDEIRKDKVALQEMIHDYTTTLKRIPVVLMPMMRPYIDRVNAAIKPGLVSLSWSSLTVNNYMKTVYKKLGELDILNKHCKDILESRIEDVLTSMSMTTLCTLPEDEAVTVDEFLKLTEETCNIACIILVKQSQLVEVAINELIEMLKIPLTPAELANMLPEDHPNNEPDAYATALNCFTQKNTEALVKCTRIALDAVKRRLQPSNRYSSQDTSPEMEKPPLFKAFIVLAIPTVVMRPSTEEIQSSVNRIVQNVLKMFEAIPQWSHIAQNQKKKVEKETDKDGDDDTVKINPAAVAKPLHKIIADHKDIVKIVIQLNTIMTSIKPLVTEVISIYDEYAELWAEEPEVRVKEFMSEEPLISECGAKLRYYNILEETIQEMVPSHRVGALLLLTEKLRMSLAAEANAWKLVYGRALNDKCARQMDNTLDFFSDMEKRLSRPVKDLDDIRSHMKALVEIREKEIEVDMTIVPIEEAYILLAKYNLTFNDGNPERVDSLSYGWSKLRTQIQEVQNHLMIIQPQFKSNLLNLVEKYKDDSSDFTLDYDDKGPMVDGIVPREASDRLTIYQSKFDELWNKFQTYSGGEELFGLPITDYPDIQKIRKELMLLQKLYSLYNEVLEKVNGYNDIAWVEIDLEKINGELQDFQAKCRKLPKALKEWQAYDELRQTIDDFNETCPLLEMMSNKAMVGRHWERISVLTKHPFDVESDNFLLRNLMEAPLLPNKEDIEEICIAAVKEKDIEAKLNVVINDWSAQLLSFAQFKTRGELLLKGDSTGEIVTLMEDSLMVLGSLLSNRYNVPFKPKIQEWVQKLTGTTEIIENWMTVQNLWIYLEAVFVGGDIAKQLPQEAKRFSNIDKSWIKIMQKAHENPNVVQCCMGDDTLSQLLPHILEQLELCQKSLTGYLEQKRLLFPRFFFVSDPSLLEILGQASDSHTIQAHLLSVFDNVKSVLFDEKIYDQIRSLVSQEGEVVDLEKVVMAQGNVEGWLLELKNMMMSSIHSIIRNTSIAIADSNFNLKEFEDSYPAQIGLLGIQMLWTRESEIAIGQARQDKKVMITANQRFIDLLNQLIDITTMDLTKIERTKYETLITIHVHQRDIFEELVKLHVKSITDFEWLKQSRFYFKEEEDKCIISITDIDFLYQNEYLGCTDRLVITPLTDRCYITLAQALGMALGGAPAGPAGTGKTESVKDMGRCLGKYVVVFNCSDQMDYRGLGRIYKGLAQSGAWGCFDEFNRIDLPVLSVAAQQIAIVLTAKKERKTEFVFTDGDIVSLNPEFGIFLTMNPGYAGRQELPENLKINFRTVAMMVPDRGIIIRVKLAACGFQQNVVLAKKFFTLYKLCEEQLSKQVHYDFGLRNILSVLRTLGSAKRQKPEDGEPTTVMRVLRDMNLSKLVDDDEPLFMSLIDDLFPGMVLDKAGYPEMEAAIEHQVSEFGLVVHAPWILKLIQLYETQNVRHGMMTLGPAGSGKTKCIHILMKAMSDCGRPHKELRMNPKAITAPQMFGRLDVATNDWTDGIFSTLWRRTHKTKKGDHIWLVLDGPVDAIWIENLNSVLDDNKTLTLANGDRITMAPNCKIIFEVHNIDNASPATVSRNGMVFMSSSIMDWDPILRGWLLSRPPAQSDIIFSMFSEIWVDLYNCVTLTLTPKMEILECMYVRQAVDLLEGLIPAAEDGKDIQASHLEKIIIFAVMWSVGSLLELDDRRKLENAMREHASKLPLPDCNGDETIYEYVVNEAGNWEHWDKRVPSYIYPSDCIPDYLAILVPNVDNTRTDFLIELISKQGKAILLIGEQGTAKTVMIQGYCNKFDPELQILKSFNFSSASTPLMFQRTLESYVDKRMGTTYGPPAGKKMSVFIDDINMPMINEWGDQVTNEITRQMMELHGFFNLEKPGEFTSIVDITLMGAMIHPGGGRNDIPQRLKRQFNIFNCTIPAGASIDKIFSNIGNGYFIPERGFTEEIGEIITLLVPTTRKLWMKVKNKMLPTPTKFHYVFNLRDLSRIWQGMLTGTANVVNSTAMVMDLWKHEATRVIADRFTMIEDKEWFDKALRIVVEDECGSALAASMQDEPFFVDFLREAPEITGDEPEDANLDAPKIYEPIDSLEQLGEKLKAYQELYNEATRSGKMDLVFFKDAMTNLVKISRVIRTSKGHSLLVGVGGSGKQSLTRLASYIAGYSSFQITLTRSYNIGNLMDDLKYLYRTAGGDGKGITFLFTDNEIKDEAFLEYMNNLLSSGEISNLFPRDEMDEILQELIGVMKKEFPRRTPTNENLYNYYMDRVKDNLHVALCFSPVGEKFRNRSLKFPALITGCTMNWFQRWPKDALVAVSNHFLSSYDLVCTPAVKQAVVNTMGLFQDMVAELCIEYFQRYRRQTHVTPKSYLSFIAGYKLIYGKKLGEIGLLAERMNTGLKKLVEATESVNVLSKELEVKEKELAIASKKTDLVLAEVTVSAQAAEKVKAQVQKVKDKAQKIVDEIGAAKSIAMGKLEAAKPALQEAETALQTIKPGHISTVRKLAKPPHLIMRIMDCVLLLFQRHIDVIQMDPDRPCMKPSWSEALKLMSAGTFLNGLLSFPKDTINDETVELLMPYMRMDDYNLEGAKKSCGDVAGLASWTKAMVSFFSINKEVLPLKANLIIQEAKLTTANADLDAAQAQLDEKQRELDVVQALYDEAMSEKQRLMDDAEGCRRKMTNASALIGGLSGERVRWTSSSKGFQQEINLLVGDVLLATGFLSYSGPFNQSFRSLMLQNWKKEMTINKIPFTAEKNLVGMLVDGATTSEWNLQGLPNDELSIQNGLIVTKASRYPLLIDPQGQGKAWIKEREKSNELQITSLNHKYFRSHLEDALSLGRPLLIEDVGEELDPAIDNVLEKNFIKSGRSLKVKVGDKEVDVMDNFRMYITTKLGNPAYTPEVSAKTSIIDFTVTIKGLEDQLLGIVILTEKKELESERVKLLEEVSANKRKMQELEDNLLYRLTSTQGSLVEDESLIEVLGVTKVTSQEVNEKLTIAAETEIRINTAREEFRPVATRGSVLYFLIVEMSIVNIMYQTSLKQFLGIFDISMAKSTKSPVNSKRIHNIIEYLTFEAFKYSARGYYEQDKFLFTILLTLKIQIQSKNIRNDEFQCFIKGGAALDLNAVEPKPKKWISDMTWLNLVELSKLGQFAQILAQVTRNDKAWKDWFDEDSPEEAIIPDGYTSTLDLFHKLLLVRSWCPDRAIPMAKLYVASAMGKEYAEGVILDLENMWVESTNRSPMSCFLSMGSDPTDNIERLAKSKGIKCTAISMGQGQEIHARKLMNQSMIDGAWVLLQNCHLGLNYMDEFLDVVNSTETIHTAFRSWITTEPHPQFPINLLQSAIKFTAEPPQGVKAGIKRTYGLVNQELLDISNMAQWKPVLYAVAFLHTTVQERRKFGPIGWNIPYEFNQSDFSATIQFVQNHLDDVDPRKGISWVTIRYMIGEVQYGGRVTDDYDKRLLITYAKVWFGDNICTDSFQFYTGYKIPKCKTIEEYRTFIETLPMVDSPETFGLHPNADITYSTNLANVMLQTILSIQPKDTGGSGGETREDVVYKLADDMLSKLPDNFVDYEVRDRLKKMGHLMPLNIFLKQEVKRMQKVISLVKITLTDLKLAVEGTIIMSEQLRDAIDNIYDARIPIIWKKISWQSLTLGFWFTDLIDRHAQFYSWVFEGRPICFMMSGFFNPQGFLTAMRQEVTRAHKGWALDLVVLDNELTKVMKEDISTAPNEGVYVYGMYIDGAGWDRRSAKLIEPSPKVLYTAMPVVHVFAINGDRRSSPTLYDCPVYKKPNRTDLTFIFALLLKTSRDPDHWTMRGVALLCDTK